MKTWSGVGSAYAASYASLCLGTADELRTELGPAQGRTLLDAGAGTGRLAAVFAADGWSVTACEPEVSMRVVAAREQPELRVMEGALPHLPLDDDEYDAVIANFVLNHVADPRQSARELARVSSGTLAATIWISSPSWFWVAVCERAGLDPAPGERLSPELDFPRTSDGFAAMLSDGGWRGVRCQAKTWTWEVTPRALWASAEGGVASAGAFYRALDPGDRGRFREAFDAVCAQYIVGDALRLAHTAAVAVGQPH